MQMLDPESAMKQWVRTLLEVLSGRMDELERDDFESTLLEARDDLADECALDAVRLDHDVGALVVSHSVRWKRYKSATAMETRRDAPVMNQY